MERFTSPTAKPIASGCSSRNDTRSAAARRRGVCVPERARDAASRDRRDRDAAGAAHGDLLRWPAGSRSNSTGDNRKAETARDGRRRRISRILQDSCFESSAARSALTPAASSLTRRFSPAPSSVPIARPPETARCAKAMYPDFQADKGRPVVGCWPIGGLGRRSGRDHRIHTPAESSPGGACRRGWGSTHLHRLPR